MPKIAKPLGALAVSKLKGDGMYAVGGVAGLYLQIVGGSRTWILRTTIGAKRHEIGLGAYPGVTLAVAREKAQENRDRIKAGGNPLLERRSQESARAAAVADAKSFKDCALAYMAAHEAGWKNAKHGQQWRNTLDAYAYPVMGDLLVRDVGLPQVLEVLEPIWHSKTETASRLRGRMELVLDWAAARGYREGANPARWRGHLDKLLPKPSKVASKSHHDALPLSQVSSFMAQLRAVEGMGARALEFTILTAARSGEVRGALWSEIDMQAATWSIPAARMKGGKDHRIPLSGEAMSLLKGLPRIGASDLVFPSPRNGKTMLSDMTLSAVLRRLKVQAVPHGFRSTFRDWAAEMTRYPGDLAEMALAHAIGSKVEAAYRRGDMFEKRRQMMEDWADFCARPMAGGEVVQLVRKAQ